MLTNDKNAAFDSRKNSKFFLFVGFDNVKSGNNNNKKNRFQFKRVYVFDEKKEKNDYESKNSNVDNDVYYNENLEYYNSNNSKNENDFITHFVVSISMFVLEYTCRRCDKTFAFNNRLHFHLRTNCFRQSFFINKLITNNYSSMSSFYSIETSFIETIKTTNTNTKNFKSIIIRFNVDFFKNVDIEYEFRDWNYVKVKIFMIKNDIEKNVAINTGIEIIFNDVNFAHKQKPNLVVRKMTSFITVRDLRTIQH